MGMEKISDGVFRLPAIETDNHNRKRLAPDVAAGLTALQHTVEQAEVTDEQLPRHPSVPGFKPVDPLSSTPDAHWGPPMGPV